MTEHISSKFTFIGAYDNRRSVSTMSAAEAHAMATPIKVEEVSQQEVEVIAASLGYVLINMSTAFSNGRMWRLMRDGLFVQSSLYGMGLNLFDVRTFLEAERYSKRFNIQVPTAIETVFSYELGKHQQVVIDVPECGYAIACELPNELDEPDWFYRDDDDLNFEFLDDARARMLTALNRDCDLAGTFGRAL